jgi:hypothetical protein
VIRWQDMPAPAPLIVTLRLDEAAFGYFDGLRRAHFPRDRNWLPAHLSLFQKLPGEKIEAISARLMKAASTTAPLALAVTGLMKLGFGTAFRIESMTLQSVRADLAEDWRAWLGPQDSQKFAPHVTIQNKVEPQSATSLYRNLAENFRPFTAQGTAFLLWHYRGGPWESAGLFEFAASAEMKP